MGLWGLYCCHSPHRWVQIACPRLSIDWGEAFGKPLLTPYEVSSPWCISGGPLPALQVTLSPLSLPRRQRWLLGTSSGNSRTPWTSMPVNPWDRGRPIAQHSQPRWALGGGSPYCIPWCSVPCVTSATQWLAPWRAGLVPTRRLPSGHRWPLLCLPHVCPHRRSHSQPPA